MRFFTTVYILLLSYIITALLFWGFSLHRQSIRIYEQSRTSLKEHVDSVENPLVYNEHLEVLKKEKGKRTAQYLGEGSTFLIIILIGAAVVYSSFRRSLRLSRQQNNFMLSVTHELKSPIAAMKLNLQTLEKYGSNLDEERKEKLIERTIHESNRLNDLCNNMLVASQMEGHQYVSAREKFDLTQFTENAVKDYAARYPNRFEVDMTDGLEVTGDKLLIQMAVNNLLENAIKYTPADSPVVVSLTTGNREALLRVADQGTGIPDEEKKKIFNKFYRVGNENTRKTKGTGLGLYLTRRIMKEHRGHISVHDNNPVGTVFELGFPLS